MVKRDGIWRITNRETEKGENMNNVIDKLLTFIALVLGLIMSFIIAIPFLILKYGAIAIAIYIVYRIGVHFFG